MTLYTFIDMDKSQRVVFVPSSEDNQLYLFAKKKSKRQFAQELAAANHGTYFVKVGEDEKLAEVLLAKLKKILKKQPDAHFMIESPRGKVAKSLDKLLNRFPEAYIMLANGTAENDDDDDNPPSASNEASETPPTQPTNKKTPSTPELPRPDWQPENIKLMQPQPNKKTTPTPSKKKVPVAKKVGLLPEITPESFADNLEKSLSTQYDLLDKVAQNHDKKVDLPTVERWMSRLDDVIVILTQGYPKKKSVLLNELVNTLNVDMAEAELVLANLVNNGMVRVESGTVKLLSYAHLRHMK